MYRGIINPIVAQVEEGGIRRCRRARRFRERTNFIVELSDTEFVDRFRVSKETFRNVLDLIEDDISHPTQRNQAISAESKLYMALRYLATGSFLLTIGDFTGVSKSSASRFIHQVCRAIARLRPLFVSFPTTPLGIRATMTEFYRRARFPRVIGAIDGTHIRIQSPGGVDAEVFRNRKGYFSITMQCVCDANLKILDVVARWPGSCHDQTMFDNSYVKHCFEAKKIPGYLVADGGYEVTSYMMTPLSQPSSREDHLYNESIIRTRNVVERCFGVLKRRFPVLSKGITVDLNNVQAIIVACTVLHNICLNREDDNLAVHNSEEEEDDAQIEDDVAVIGSRRGRQERDALIRNHFANLQ